jgi:hypothetical protein
VVAPSGRLKTNAIQGVPEEMPPKAQVRREFAACAVIAVGGVLVAVPQLSGGRAAERDG